MLAVFTTASKLANPASGFLYPISLLLGALQDPKRNDARANGV
jgi:hypothetical protein